jgi:hypothetical protein
MNIIWATNSNLNGWTTPPEHRALMTRESIAAEIAKREGKPDPLRILRGLKICLASPTRQLSRS